jgi:hypothetical protein
MKRRIFYLFVLVTILIPFFTACGGGGGGGGGGIDSRINNYNVNLKSLSVSSGTLSPVFSPDTTSYNLEVTGTTDSITIKPGIADSTSTISINNQAVDTESEYTASLDTGINAIKVIVKAADDATAKTYNISVNRLSGSSSNADLAGLEISDGTLSPLFSANTTGYDVNVSVDTSSINVKSTVAGINASVTVNGNPVASGSESSTVNLSNATTNVIVKVSAENSTLKTYNIKVNKAVTGINANLSDIKLSSGELSPGFEIDRTVYTVYESNTIANITVTPFVAEKGSTVKVNGTSVTSGKASASIYLPVGSSTITINVKSKKGVLKTYTLEVIRAAAGSNENNNSYLANLTVSTGKLSPGFDMGITAYSVDVEDDRAGITITPTTSASDAVVTVNNYTVSSGTISQFIPLATGTNTISVVVTARDGTAKTYTIEVMKCHPGLVREFEADDVPFNMIYVPARTFPTSVNVFGDATVPDPYWIGETEVTYELWERVRLWAAGHGYCFDQNGTGDITEPVGKITWRDCIIWCNALTEFCNAFYKTSYKCVYYYNGIILRNNQTDTLFCDKADVDISATGSRLRTGDEGCLAAKSKGSNSSNGAVEYPAGSGWWWTPGTYASGAAADYNNAAATGLVAVYNQGGSSSVKSKQPNILGIYDMSGNAYEWCFDFRVIMIIYILSEC